MARFSSAIALAYKLIKKNGQAVTLRKVGITAPANPSKPWIPGINTNIDYPCTAVFFNEKESFKDSETLRQSTQIAYLASTGLSTTPDIDDLIVQAGQSWKIQDIETLAPNGEQILFKLSLG